MTKYLSFQEFGQESELTHVAEGKCPRIDASNLPCITKINHMVNDLGKLLSIMEYIDETIFERRYGRIAQLMRLPVQAATIKALLNFWDPSYRCFTFGNIDMTPTLEEYERILDFPNNSHRIYLRRRFEDTASEVVSLLGLGKINLSHKKKIRINCQYYQSLIGHHKKKLNLNILAINLIFFS